MPSPPPSWSRAQLKACWQSILSASFQETDFFDLLVATRFDLPLKALLRVVGELLAREAADSTGRRFPLVLNKISDWPMTTRIDGILPLRIPLARDIGDFVSGWLRQMETVGLDLPDLDKVDRVEREVALCLLGWFHQRQLASDHGMCVELATLCPHSALGVKDEVCVMGQLPNGGRITVFYSALKSRDALTMPALSLEHYDVLKARRVGGGELRLVGSDWPENDPLSDGDRHSGGDAG